MVMKKYNKNYFKKEGTDSNQRARGGDNGGWEREGSTRNMYKGPMDKAKEG